MKVTKPNYKHGLDVTSPRFMKVLIVLVTTTQGNYGDAAQNDLLQLNDNIITRHYALLSGRIYLYQLCAVHRG